MSGVAYRAGFGFRQRLLGTIAFATVLALVSHPADARWKRKGSGETASISSDSRYAAIVVDGNSGNPLHAANPDSLRHPASLTKIMTLYLLFERLETNKVTLDTEMSVTANAASQPPTKLGVKPGQTLKVEDAIKALVTKSANDAAVVLAEYMAGTEDDFAKLMTRKARALGMSKTLYMNASGLPDDDQVTTARDQALLGLAIQERFPRYYKYFSTSSFSYKGRGMRNHNRLLGRVAGVDGIKTGYTNASGFNLVTSLRRGNRHVVAVVLGGRTAGQRDARMETLLEEYVVVASTQKSNQKFAETAEPSEPQVAKTKIASASPIPLPQEKPRTELASKSTRAEVLARIEAPTAVSTTAAIPEPPPGSTEPIKPLLVKTLSVRPGVQTASLAPVVTTVETPPPSSPNSESIEASAPPPPVALPAAPAVAAPPLAFSSVAPPAGARPGVLGVLTIRHAQSPSDIAPVETRLAESKASPDRRETLDRRDNHHARNGWMIQVGAFPDENEAKQRLSSAKNKASSLLGAADPFTETIVKGDKKLYRARFAGLEKEQAESACKTLKRNEIACMAIKN